MQELKPCPFCGNSDTENCSDDGIYWVRCKTCGATGPTVHRYPVDELEDSPDWNSRALPSAHRIVPVELLEVWERAMRYERFGEHADQVRAIIDKEPT